MQKEKKYLDQAIRAPRLNRAWTQEQFIDKAGGQPRMILEVETSRGNPQSDNLYQNIRLLAIRPNDIFYGFCIIQCGGKIRT